MERRIIHITGYYFSGGILLLLSNAPKIDTLKSDPIGKFIIFRVSNTRDVIVNIYAPSGILKEKQKLRTKLLP